MCIEELATDGDTALAGTLNQGARLRRLLGDDSAVTLFVVFGETTAMARVIALMSVVWTSDDTRCPSGTRVSVSLNAPTVAAATTTAASARGNDGAPLLYVARLCDAGASSVTSNPVALAVGSPVVAWIWVIAEFAQSQCSILITVPAGCRLPLALVVGSALFTCKIARFAHLQSSILINVPAGRRMFLSFASGLVGIIAVNLCRRRFICRVALAMVPSATIVFRSSNDDASNTESRLQQVTPAVKLWDIGSRQNASGRLRLFGIPPAMASRAATTGLRCRTSGQAAREAFESSLQLSVLVRSKASKDGGVTTTVASVTWGSVVRAVRCDQRVSLVWVQIPSVDRIIGGEILRNVPLSGLHIHRSDAVS